jgi:hypothetical protein
VLLQIAHSNVAPSLLDTDTLEVGWSPDSFNDIQQALAALVSEKSFAFQRCTSMESSAGNHKSFLVFLSSHWTYFDYIAGGATG